MFSLVQLHHNVHVLVTHPTRRLLFSVFDGTIVYFGPEKRAHSV